ncbi:MAG TPA: vWA domain-containing protein [Terriglobales bacterium]|nr:vWA domain-containing protein [Terriglobales bacterium]
MARAENTSRNGDRKRAIAISVCALFLFLTPSLLAQASSTDALSGYVRGVQLSDPARRLAAMEEFLRSDPSSSLARDALEIATWDSIQIGDTARCSRWGGELLKRSPRSPLAQAALSLASHTPSLAGIESLRSALSGLDQIHKPEGFSEAEFAELRRRVWLLLDGAMGLDYVALQQYEDARPYLKLAVSIAPNDPRFTYSYALALLSGKNPDTKNGYWQLARAVNLNAGSSAGAGIAQYARSKYRADGGTDADWKQFVAVTSIGTHNQTRAMEEYRAASGTAALGTTVTAKKLPEGVPPLPPKTADEEPQSQTASALPQLKLAPPTDPVSLGILLQTGLLKGENRKVILNALRDLVLHLRENDEAFLMAFSDQLDFEQDLTAQDQLLDDALVHLKAGSGAALVDGVSFAIGHLDRIAKNRNRVLLVISDGRNTVHSPDMPPLSSELHDVRIDCIGVNASAGADQSLLQRLSWYSRGNAIFVSDPQQFRAATFKIAQSMGIDFPL